MNGIKFYKQVRKLFGFLYFYIVLVGNYLLDFVLDQDQILKEISNLKFSEIKELFSESIIRGDAKNFLLENNNYSRHYCVLKYKDQRIKNLIWQLKFNGNRKIAGILANFLVEKIVEIQAENQDVKNLILIPIPIHRKRRAERGYNQCEWLCEEILKIKKIENRSVLSSRSSLLSSSILSSRSGLLGGPSLFYFPKILVRQKYTIKQSWVSKKERLENIHGVFKLTAGRRWRNFIKKNNLNKNNSAFIIIDDVYTTGSTIKEASKILSELNFQIISLTVAN